ncbi:MAG: hypothetical protein ACFFE8_12590 [Candidatus Heimdallarchaeota archaeon]
MEVLLCLLMSSLNNLRSSKAKESIGYRKQEEILEEFDLEKLVELYKKKSDKKRDY